MTEHLRPAPNGPAGPREKANDLPTQGQVTLAKWPKLAPFTTHEAENSKLRDYWREFAMASHERLLLALEVMGEEHNAKVFEPECPLCAALRLIGEVPSFGPQ